MPWAFPASKLVVLVFLGLTYIGTTSQSQRLSRPNVLKRLGLGLVLYAGADVFLQLTAAPTTIAGCCIATT